MTPAVARSRPKVATEQRNHWNQASAQYASASQLFAPEAAFLSIYRNQLQQSSLLDLGIGAGRTTRHFAPLCRAYTGIDYAPAMVEQARKNCPQFARRIHEADARDLSRFASGVFDCVLFSFNGLDCLDPEGRTQVLREVYRVLRPGGLFSFSSHNLDSVPMPGVSWPRPPLNPTNLWQTAYRLLQRTRRNMRIRPLVRTWDTAAVRQRGWHCFADGGESYEIPLYYVSLTRQRQELTEAGLHLFSVQDRDCRELLADHLEQGSQDSWLYYLAGKR